MSFFSFCKKVFFSVCSFVVGLMFSVYAQDEDLKTYELLCFPLILNDKITFICPVGRDEEDGDGEDEGEVEGNDSKSKFKGFYFFGDKNYIPIEDRDRLFIDMEGTLINPELIEKFDRRGKVIPICDPIFDGMRFKHDD